MMTLHQKILCITMTMNIIFIALLFGGATVIVSENLSIFEQEHILDHAKQEALYELYRTSIYSLFKFILFVSIVTGASMLYLLEKLVLSRVVRLSQHIERIRLDGDLSTVFKEKGRDEVTELAQAINRMLTELMQSHAELRENEERYRTLVETSPDAIMVTDLSGYLIMANQRSVELYGYEHVEELFDLDALTLIHQDAREVARKAICNILETGNIKNAEYTMLKKNGATFLAELNVSVITDAEGHPKALMNIIRDLTGRKQTETALRKSEERYRNLIENAPLGIVSINTQGEIMDVNSMLVAMLGSPSVRAMREMNMLTLPSLVEAEIAGDFGRCLESGLPEIAERPYMSEWGKEVYLRYHLTPIREADLTISGVQAIVEDISEQKWAQEALQESEAEYRMLFKNMLSGFAYHKIVVDEYGEAVDYVFLSVNEAYERLIGLGKEVIGKRASDVIPELKSLEPDLIHTYGEVALIGEQITFDLYFKPFEMWFAVSAYSPEKGYFVTILDDITERKLVETTLRKMNEQLEQRVEARTIELQEANTALADSLEKLRQTQERLVQTEKMAALGGLVAGVAHEINTPVGIGVTAASHLEEQTLEIERLYSTNQMKRSDLEEYLHTATESSKMILGTLRRAADQVQSFKQIAVDQASDEKRLFKMKPYVEGVLFSLQPKLRKTKHTVIVHCAEEIEILSYPGAVSQIITNLVMNSLIHGFEEMDEGEIVLEIKTEHNTLFMHYQDNGRGMAEEICSKIFEPFFTTKRAQGGSGLGMHIVYNLVTQRLQGQIECKSRPREGASFFIQIPLEEQ